MAGEMGLPNLSKTLENTLQVMAGDARREGLLNS